MVFFQSRFVPIPTVDSFDISKAFPGCTRFVSVLARTDDECGFFSGCCAFKISGVSGRSFTISVMKTHLGSDQKQKMKGIIGVFFYFIFFLPYTFCVYSGCKISHCLVDKDTRGKYPHLRHRTQVVMSFYIVHGYLDKRWGGKGEAGRRLIGNEEERGKEGGKYT